MTISERDDKAPAHDLLIFQGYFRNSKLEGKILIEDILDNPPKIFNKLDHITMRKDDKAHISDYESYNEYCRFWEPVIKYRGPKW
jgi:hypothetical protein